MKNLRNILILAAAISVQSMMAENLVLMHTNDTHSQIDPYGADDMAGVARRKVLIDSIRNAADNSILIDAGDVVQGSLFFNLYKGELEEKLLNALGYDLRILGNHEFDNGMQDLADNLATADATLLCANYNTRNTPLEGLFKPYEIKDIDGKRIAFMPINLQPKGMIAARNVEGMGYLDAQDYADRMGWYLKNVENADMVIAISHVGYDSDTTLIANSHNIDLLIGGHTHTYLDPSDPNSLPTIIKNADGREIRIAQAGKAGKYLGEITIDLDNLNALPQSRLIPVDSRLDERVDGSIEEIIAPYRQSVEALDNTYLTYAPKDLPRDGQALLNFIADFVYGRGKELDKDLDLAIINKGGLRNDIPKGKVSEGQLITLMPFFNRIQVIEVSGSDLLKNFDVMARQGGQGVSENVEAIFDPDTDKCISLTINGKPVVPEKTYRLATIDYLANGGDYMTPLTDHKLVNESHQYLFEDLVDYFKTNKGKQMKAKDITRMKAK